jgi:hypothetical protein
VCGNLYGPSVHYLVLILLILTPTKPVLGQSLADIPLSHPIYNLLDRLETRGIVPGTMSGIRPYSASLVNTLAHKAIETKRISPAERALLQRYLVEYDTGQPLVSGTNRKFPGIAYAYSDTAVSLRIRPLLRQAVHFAAEADSEDVISQTYIGISVDGHAHRYFSFRIQHFEAREWSDVARTSPADVWAHPIETVQLKDRSADFRESRYQFRVDLPWFSFDLGKQSFDWGPARQANLAVHHSSPSFVYGRLSAAYKAIIFEHLMGALRTAPDAIDLGSTTVSNGHRRTLPPPKRIVAHRLEADLTSRLKIGVHETVIYGDRGFEPAYALPVSVLAGAQAYAGETDNLTLGADFSYRFSPGAKVYGAVFFDDLQKFSPGAFSNQVGLQLGGHWVSPLGIRDVDLRLEFAHIEPYTYAHNFDINSYTHFRYVLGHPLGPNADHLYMELNWLTNRWTQLTAYVDRTREGDNYQQDGALINVGGDPYQGRRPTDPPDRSFLAGDRSESVRLGFRASIEPIPSVRVRLAYLYNRRQITRVIGGLEPTQTGHVLSISSELNAF